MRQGTHRWLMLLALSVGAVGCGSAGASTQSTQVAGVQVTRPNTPSQAVAQNSQLNETIAAAAATETPLPRIAGDVVTVAPVDGVERTWTLVIPPGVTTAERVPLVVVLHGVGGKGDAMRRLGYDTLAAPARVMMAYPDAHGGSWNDGRPGMEPLSGTPADDVAFLKALIGRAVERGADPDRVAIIGFSNGALMASRAACDMSDQLAAVVMVSGSGPPEMRKHCAPARPLAVMLVFGTADTVVPYDGGNVSAYNGKPRGRVASVNEVVDLWRTTNVCSGTENTSVPGAAPTVIAVRGVGCQKTFVHYKVSGGGHEWFAPPTFDTTNEAWKFVLTNVA